MIIGIDLGNYATKTSERINFLSKVSKISNILNNPITLTTSEGDFYMGDGNFDTEYRKLKKENVKEMFITAIALSSEDINNQIVVGLPLSQYKEDKENLKQLLLEDRIQHVIINGIERKIIIEDLDIYPEGIGALIGNQFNGIIVDIGGRTTDIALLESSKVKKPYSLSVGTLNLYSDFIKVINNKYSLDLKSEDAPRIIKNGLKIYGEEKDITFGMDVFKSYVDVIVNELQVSYSIKTLDIMLVGGGSKMLYKGFKSKIPNIELIDNSIFANANGFRKVGENLWL